MILKFGGKADGYRLKIFELRAVTAAQRLSSTKEYTEFGDVVTIDGSLINAVLIIYWADYRRCSKKTKGRLGFNINQGIPSNVFLTGGKGAERPSVSLSFAPGQTGLWAKAIKATSILIFCKEKAKTLYAKSNHQPQE